MIAIGKNVIIQPIEEQIKTDSGLLLTASDVEGFRYKKGKVIKEGTDVQAIKGNDIIYYDKSAGFSLLINNITYTIINERDIVVVL
jgi:co-chaperonin GroES (HSP10)|tara:strand:+ start:1925 stop:2182 length:258 start_codon:yes stop_codon:yes gene_type:complete